MELVANLWWLWLAVLVCAGVYAAVNQAKRMNGMLSGSIDAFSEGLGSMIAAGFVLSVSFLLLAIAVLYNIFHN